MMKSVYFLGLVLLSSVAVRGQNEFVLTHNISEAIQSVPPCTQKCLLPVVSELTCNVTTLPQLALCLCPNDALQGRVSSCVERHCTFMDQVVTAEANQQLCKNIPIPSRSHEVLVTVVAVTAAAFPFVIARIWSRLQIAGMFGYDDWAMLVAAVLILAIMGIEIEMSVGGWGNHIWTLDVNMLPVLLKLFYGTQIIYICIQCTTKLSILLFYLRIFPQRWFVIAAKITIAFIVSSDLVFIFIIAFQCIPINAIWDHSIQGSCLNHSAIIFSGAGFSILEHVVILLLPIPCISSLKVGKGKRISLFVMFSIGTFALAASLVRLKYVGKFGTSTDATWDNADVEIWSTIEIAVALICACLPALRPLLTRYVPVLFGSTGRTRPSDYYNHTFDGTHHTFDGTHRNLTGTTTTVVEAGETGEEKRDGVGALVFPAASRHSEGWEGRVRGTDSGGGFERRYTLERGELRDKDAGSGSGSGRSFTIDRRWSGMSHASDVELVIMKPEMELVIQRPDKIGMAS